MKPIRPDEVNAAKSFPDEVLEAFNGLITSNMRNGIAIVTRREAINGIIDKFNGMDGLNPVTDQYIMEKSWLDVESVYRQAGWDVQWNKADYTETWYEPYFQFTRKRS